MYSFEHNRNKRVLIANIKGSLGIEQASSLLEEFKNLVGNINTKEYALIINPENISASILILPLLQSLIQLIIKLNFKKIYVINSDKYAEIIKQNLGRYPAAPEIIYKASIEAALKS